MKQIAVELKLNIMKNLLLTLTMLLLISSMGFAQNLFGAGGRRQMVNDIYQLDEYIKRLDK